MHRIFAQEFPDGSSPAPIEIGGEEAEHALRVKRLRDGDEVEILDGAGRVASAVVEMSARADGKRAERVLRLRIEHVRRVPAARPILEVCSAVPKGGRVDEIIDQLSQIGAASWRPLECARSVVEARPAKLDRLRRIALEACKQAGRAWVLKVGEPIRFGAALNAPAGISVIVADAAGAPRGPLSTDSVRLLVGPEGGFTPEELAAAQTFPGVVLARFGPHIMRIETAAVAGASVIMGASRQ